MRPYGSLWVLKVLFASVWILMGLYGSVEVLIRFCGFDWVLNPLVPELHKTFVCCK